MQQNFRKRHIYRIWDLFCRGNHPMDRLLSHYFRKHKSLGSKDRKEIGETLFQLIRKKLLIDFFCPSNLGEDRLATLEAIKESRKSYKDLPKNILYNCSEFFLQRLEAIFGEEKAEHLLQTLSENAPTTIRANTIKTTKEALFSSLNKRFSCAFCQHAKNGIRFAKKEPLFSLPEFREGLFEMQDEGSQLLADLVEIQPKQHFLDYCSGSGGKTLAIAPKMKGTGQIYLHDKRKSILFEAKKRCKRAGVQNVQFRLPQKMLDWLLLDVPCSGTGTLRRTPESFWKIEKPMLLRLIEEQREIFQKAFSYLKPGGKIVYATCSILPEENEEQIAFFCQNFAVDLEKTLSLLPQSGGMDGFFGAVLKKRSLV